MISDSKLNEDIKQFFINHSKHIINVDEFCTNQSFQLTTICSIPDVDEMYVELRKWKRISQLILNLYNNYEIYAKFEVKIMDIKSSNEQYRDNSKPNIDDVIDALYQYALYFLIIQREETRTHFKDILDACSLMDYNCSLCDTLLQMGDSECPVCNEPVESMIKNMRKSLTLSNTDTQGINNDIPIQDGDMDIDNLVPLEDNLMGNTSNGVWKCARCESMNEEKDVKCRMCQVSQEMWVCKKCTMRNDKLLESCIACGGDKEDTMKRVKEYCQKCGNNEIIRDKSRSTSWHCQYQLCKHKNYGDGSYCQLCGLAKGSIGIGGAALSRCKDGKMDEIWICDKCDKINEDCSGLICAQCGVTRFVGFEIVNSVEDIVEYVNDKCANGDEWQCSHCQCLNRNEYITCIACSKTRLQLWTCKKCSLENRIPNTRCVGCGYERRFCENCRYNEIIDGKLCGDCLARSPNWECWYMYCKKINYGHDMYCGHCGLERYPNKLKGASVWLRNGATIDQIWICDKCGRRNNKYNKNCENYVCRTPRIMLFNWCTNCGRGNPYAWFASNCPACGQSMWNWFK